MKALVVLLFFAVAIVPHAGYSQDEREMIFNDPIDTVTRTAEPVGGYTLLLKRFQTLIDAGDTLDKRYPMELDIIRFKVDARGNVDSITMINHMACSIHRKIGNALRNTKWTSARDKGNPVDSYVSLNGLLYFNKPVYKKYKCWANWMERRP